MSNFQLGILIGFFLGVLVMFMALVIIHLYLIHLHVEERRKKNALARERGSREIYDDREAPSYTSTKGPQITSRS
jgi:hypothetical protein